MYPLENDAYEFVLYKRYPVLLVSLGRFVKWWISGCIVTVLWVAASRICSKQLAASMCSSSCFSKSFVKVQVLQPCNSTDMATTTWKKYHVILLEWFDFVMVDNQLIAIQAFPIRMLTSLSVNEILLPSYVKWYTNSRSLFNVEMAPSSLKHINSVLSENNASCCLFLAI